MWTTRQADTADRATEPYLLGASQPVDARFRRHPWQQSYECVRCTQCIGELFGNVTLSRAGLNNAHAISVHCTGCASDGGFGVREQQPKRLI